MNNNLIAPELPANLVTWFTDERGGTGGFTEASALGFKPGEFPCYRLYNDSCDVGLVLVNPSKGTKAVFNLVNEEGGKWTLVSYPRDNPQNKMIYLIVFND